MKKMKLLTKRQQEPYKNAKKICQENLKINIWKIKKYSKVRDHCHYIGEYRGAAHSICDLKHSVHKRISDSFL